MSSKIHWEQVYAIKSTTAVSWYQAEATLSLGLICQIAPSPDANIIDVGGGASTLVDGLLESGYRNLTVLDLASEALSVARQRLGRASDAVHWLEGDITTLTLPAQAYDIWHDRAVFHFLTNPEDRLAYVKQVMHAVKPGGHVIIATFAPDGPTECSGLPVVRYAPDTLKNELGREFLAE
jgi:ubiquinone/menaquinone biosynthesis C-methylase UbiE